MILRWKTAESFLTFALSVVLSSAVMKPSLCITLFMPLSRSILSSFVYASHVCCSGATERHRIPWDTQCLSAGWLAFPLVCQYYHMWNCTLIQCLSGWIGGYGLTWVFWVDWFRQQLLEQGGWYFRVVASERWQWASQARLGESPSPRAHLQQSRVFYSYVQLVSTLLDSSQASTLFVLWMQAWPSA